MLRRIVRWFAAGAKVRKHRRWTPAEREAWIKDGVDRGDPDAIRMWYGQ